MTFMNCKAIDRIKDNSGKTIGYLMLHKNGTQVPMKSEDIKRCISNKEFCPGNLKITANNRLVHIPENDKYGLDVSPVYFFNGQYGNWTLNCDGRMIRATSNKYKVQVHFNMTTFNNDRAWQVIQLDTDKVLLGNHFGAIVYRDIIGSLDEFVEKIEIAYKNKRTDRDMLEIKYLEDYERTLNHRSSYEYDYKNGFTEEKEKAYHILRYLDEKKEWYLKNKYKLDNYRNKEPISNGTKGNEAKLAKFISEIRSGVDKVERFSANTYSLSSRCRGGNDYDDAEAYIKLDGDKIIYNATNCRGFSSKGKLPITEIKKLYSILHTYEVMP